MSAHYGATRNPRDPERTDVVVKFASQPKPKIREATAIALGRMKNQETYAVLLTLLGVAEPNQNVRLAARKGLQALAGNVDAGYDVDEWRKVFDRGGR